MTEILAAFGGILIGLFVGYEFGYGSGWKDGWKESERFGIPVRHVTFHHGKDKP